ncbi:hypothetical protein PIB30_061724 [Stylosanthes scabra]|uniref:Uncharacterized protein n=1 Tax=Stylosanthes scabra TaxID=79078 RepID=A0ABU6WNN7_9FABA|nr:hypothetical protein [Stylosanthes scabra]
MILGSWTSITMLTSMLDHHLNHKTRKHACGLNQIRTETWNGGTSCGVAYPLDACVIDAKRTSKASRGRKPWVNRSSGSKVIASGSWREAEDVRTRVLNIFVSTFMYSIPFYFIPDGAKPVLSS